MGIQVLAPLKVPCSAAYVGLDAVAHGKVPAFLSFRFQVPGLPSRCPSGRCEPVEGFQSSLLYGKWRNIQNNIFGLSRICRDFSTFRRKKRILARNTPISGGYHGNSQLTYLCDYRFSTSAKSCLRPDASLFRFKFSRSMKLTITPSISTEIRAE